MNSGFEYREVVPPASAGRALLDHLAGRHRHSSREEWGARVREGRVLIDGVAADHAAVLATGQSIVWRRPPWEEPQAPLQWALLHRDDDVLAVAKPAGLPTLPGGGYLENTLLHRVRARFPEAVPVHRLDRGTSGVVLFARTPAAGAALSEAFRARRTIKIYRAIVEGHVGRESFQGVRRIGRFDLGDGRRAWLDADGRSPGLRSDGPTRLSRTSMRVLERRPDGTTLLEVRPETGRPHQIRIHLAAEGHPLVGDPFYAEGGGPKPGALRPGEGGFFLHAEGIEVAHPRGTGMLRVTCLPPKALRTADEVRSPLSS